MEDFKKLPKMQSFKVGGSVENAYCGGGRMKKGGEVDAADIAQDKKIVKKAFAMHDKQEHAGEKTDLSKLKKGGRSKKEVGTVKKYKTGGEVTNVYEAKKSSGDKDNIKKVKEQVPVKLCGGKSVKKYSEGKTVDSSGSVLDTIKSVGKRLYENVMGTPEQNAAAQARLDKYEASKKAAAPSAPVAKKRGGRC
jgi:hypothetical protein